MRAYAVVAVILFHLGYLPNGYVGVDVFFVISGFLITSIIYKDLHEKKFSIRQFYERRIRRIFPLLLFISSFALFVGVFLMLPNDLENLAQSVVASNFSANNILMLITSSDYWAIKNDYKPLIHTWSLGVEEQYYLIYPFLLILLSKIKIRVIPYFLFIAFVVSVVLFLFFGNPATRFYLLHFRFFELAIGGLFAVLLFGKKSHQFLHKYIFYASVLGLFLLLTTSTIWPQFLVIFTSLCTALMLSSTGFLTQKNIVLKALFQNKLIVYLGKISFSLYMWHQLIFAFSRYAYFEEIGIQESLLLSLLTLLLSVLTFHFIENPFRNKHSIPTKKMLLIVGLGFVVSTSSAFYIYLIGGVYKDFPEIGLTTEEVSKQGFNFFSSTDNIHIHYNEKIRQLDKDFDETNTYKVLVVGHSFGRDVANIFLESKVRNQIDLSYFDIDRINTDGSIAERWQKADLVVIGTSMYLSKDWVLSIGKRFDFSIDLNKVAMFGNKDYGHSNGIHFNRMPSIEDVANYYIAMRKGSRAIDEKLQEEWEPKYVSLIQPISNENGKIRIFTNQGQFISQDTYHLTKAGAQFYAKILADEIHNLVKIEP